MQIQNNVEAIPGYTIRQRIGAGGYGEVWLADAPGGLQKAIKFVYGYLDDQRAAREFKALDRIKQVRHPFLISLERIEIVEGQLLIVTELAESSLKDRFDECIAQGQPGISRQELLMHMRDVADALDFMTEKHSLQHLDIKPENLLLVGGRIKVADFGLVKEIRDVTASLMGGLTPLYAPPEVFDNRPSRFSDQYSLAIVYQEMLTGVLPFPGRTAAQLAAQHISSRPRLSSLSPEDQTVIAKALEKDPTSRYECCREMVEALLGTQRQAESPPPPDPDSPLAGSAASNQHSSPPPLHTTRADQSCSKGAPRPIAQSLPLTERRLSQLRKSLLSPKGEVENQGALAGEISLSELFAQSDVANLPPVDLSQSQPALQPTLFVGVGGFAGRVLRRLRARIRSRLGDQGAQSLRLLLMDVDSKAVNKAQHAEGHGEDDQSLDSKETLILPLRRPRAYRKDSKSYFQWLSRRWLYNIPRSMLTEGMRPLGRLALADHAATVMERLKTALAEATDANALEAAAAAANMPSCKRPRVVLIASISGGAGGGMVLDMAYMARQVMESLGLGECEVVGLLAHGAGRVLRQKELALANTYATLSELYHYNCSMTGYPGDPSCNLAPALADQLTFDHSYLLYLGDDLGEDDFAFAADEIAEYLYRDSATTAGAFFQACRQFSSGQQASDVEPSDPRVDVVQPSANSDSAPAPPSLGPKTFRAKNGSGRLQLRTMGLCRVDSAPEEVIGAVVDRLCRNMIHFWRGAPLELDAHAAPPLPTRAPAPSEQIVNTQEIDQFGEELCKAWSQATPGSTSLPNLDGAEPLLAALQTAAQNILGSEPRQHFKQMFAKLTGGNRKVNIGRVMEAYDAFFGAHSLEEALRDAAQGSFLGALANEAGQLAQKRAEVIRQGVLDLLDRSTARTAGAMRAAEWCVQHLLQLEEQITEAANSAAADLHRLQRSLPGRKNSPSPGGGDKSCVTFEGEFKLTGELAQSLSQYPQLRLQHIVAALAARVVRQIRDEAEKVEQAVQDVRRQLNLFKEEHLGAAHEMIHRPDSTGSHAAIQFWDQAHQRMEEMVVQTILGLEKDFRDQAEDAPSLLAEAARGQFDFGADFLSPLRDAAEQAVNGILRDIDVTAALLEAPSPDQPCASTGSESVAETKPPARPKLEPNNQPNKESPESEAPADSPLDRILLASTPPLLACGGGARMLAILPEGSNQARLQETMHQRLGENPTVMGDRDRDVLFCCEVEGLSLADVAKSIIGGHEEYVKVARRLHVRVDIDWKHWK